MAGHTRQQIEVAKQFRKALALDLVTEGAPAAYELLKLTVKGALSAISNDPSYIPNRQQVDSAGRLLLMAGLSERVAEPDQSVSLGKLSLAELEAMIRDLKVIEHAPDAAQSAHADTQELDIFK